MSSNLKPASHPILESLQILEAQNDALRTGIKKENTSEITDTATFALEVICQIKNKPEWSTLKEDLQDIETRFAFYTKRTNDLTILGNVHVQAIKMKIENIKSKALNVKEEHAGVPGAPKMQRTPSQQEMDDERFAELLREIELSHFQQAETLIDRMKTVSIADEGYKLLAQALSKHDDLKSLLRVMGKIKNQGTAEPGKKELDEKIKGAGPAAAPQGTKDPRSENLHSQIKSLFESFQKELSEEAFCKLIKDCDFIKVLEGGELIKAQEVIKGLPKGKVQDYAYLLLIQKYLEKKDDFRARPLTHLMQNRPLGVALFFEIGKIKRENWKNPLIFPLPNAGPKSEDSNSQAKKPLRRKTRKHPPSPPYLADINLLGVPLNGAEVSLRDRLHPFFTRIRDSISSMPAPDRRQKALDDVEKMVLRINGEVKRTLAIVQDNLSSADKQAMLKGMAESSVVVGKGDPLLNAIEAEMKKAFSQALSSGNIDQQEEQVLDISLELKRAFNLMRDEVLK